MPPPLKTPKYVSNSYIFPLTANIIGVVVFSQLRPKAQASVARAADTRPLGCGDIPLGEDVAYHLKWGCESPGSRPLSSHPSLRCLRDPASSCHPRSRLPAHRGR